MPNYKLLIEYSGDEPIYPFERCRIEQSDTKSIHRLLADNLALGTDFFLVTPLDAKGNVIEDVPILSHFIKRKPKRVKR